MCGVPHNGNVEFWRPGELATTGIKNVAELGDCVVFLKEMQAEATLGNADMDQFLTLGIDSPGTDVATLRASFAGGDCLPRYGSDRDGRKRPRSRFLRDPPGERLSVPLTLSVQRSNVLNSPVLPT